VKEIEENIALLQSVIEWAMMEGYEYGSDEAREACFNKWESELEFWRDELKYLKPIK